MNIQILVIPGCPHRQLAEDRVREAVSRVGARDVTVDIRMISDQSEAEQAGFAGSPTILVDGHDPFADGASRPAMACRVYPTDDGLDGAPSVDRIRQALGSA